MFLGKSLVTVYVVLTVKGCVYLIYTNLYRRSVLWEDVKIQESPEQPFSSSPVVLETNSCFDFVADVTPRH